MARKSFKQASVKISADWKSKYAQGGLILFYPADDSTDPSSNPPQWIKTGIEFEDSKIFASVVAARPFSDWSLQRWNGIAITVEAVRERNGLWIYALEGNEKLPLRQITWAFEGQEEGKVVEVGVYVAMPKGLENVEDGGDLTVTFQDLSIETI